MLVFLTAGITADETGFKSFKTGLAAYTGASVLPEGYDQQGLWIAGVVHITPRIAVRPQFLLIIQDRESKDVFPKTATNTFYDDMKGAGIDLFYFWPRGGRSLLYAGPSVRYLQYKDEYDNDSGTFGRYKTDSFRMGLICGGQYMFDENFGFFGDIGMGVDISKQVEKDYDAGGSLTGEDENTSVIYSSMGARLGGVFYFN